MKVKGRKCRIPLTVWPARHEVDHVFSMEDTCIDIIGEGRGGGGKGGVGVLWINRQEVRVTSTVDRCTTYKGQGKTYFYE